VVLGARHFLSFSAERSKGAGIKPHHFIRMSATTRETGLGALGPYYDYSNEMLYPSEIGIRRDGDIGSGPGQIYRNVAGVQYYVDTMAFGTPTKSIMGNGVDFPQSPLGLNYFFNTGQRCSNGADMYQFMSTIPSGLPGDMGKGLKATLGANLQGLAPGALQDSFEAMNPIPVFNAVMGTGYAKCKLMEAPVGNADGKLSSRFLKPIYNADPTGSDDPPIEVPNVWVEPVADKVYYKPATGRWVNDPFKGYQWVKNDGSTYVPKGPQPHMRRWVFDKWISQDEYNWTQSVLKRNGRLYTSADIPDQNTRPDPPIPQQPSANQQKAALQDKGTEGFSENLDSSQIGAGILFAGLFLGLVAFTAVRK